jgi:hypothetical protein
MELEHSNRTDFAVASSQPGQDTGLVYANKNHVANIWSTSESARVCRSYEVSTKNRGQNNNAKTDTEKERQASSEKTYDTQEKRQVASQVASQAGDPLMFSTEDIETMKSSSLDVSHSTESWLRFADISSLKLSLCDGLQDSTQVLAYRSRQLTGAANSSSSTQTGNKRPVSPTGEASSRQGLSKRHKASGPGKPQPNSNDDDPSKPPDKEPPVPDSSFVTPIKHKKPFNLFQRLIEHPEICLSLAEQIEPNTLCNLYSVSKPFHYIMNSHFVTFMKSNAKVWAPFGADTFPYQSFKRLCIADPSFKPLERNADKARHVPGFKWLKMVRSRHVIVNNILDSLEKEGHRLPRNTDVVLQKIWFTMALPGTAARIAILHNATYWQSHELFLATMFFIKLDMRLTDPVEGMGETILRETFLAQKSLLPLLALISGKLNFIEIVQFWILYDYRPRPEHTNMSLFGVPSRAVGRGCYEFFGAGTRRALRVDEAVMLESIRRDLAFNRHYLDSMLWGYQVQSDNIPKHLLRKT